MKTNYMSLFLALFFLIVLFTFTRGWGSPTMVTAKKENYCCGGMMKPAY